MGDRWRVLQSLSWAPRRLVTALFTVSLFSSLVPTAIALVTGRVVGAAAQHRPVLALVVGLCLLLAARESLMHTINLLNTTLGRRIDGRVRSEVRRHLAAAATLGRVEDPAVIADATLAATSGGPSGYVRSIGSGAFGLVQNGFQLLSAALSCLAVASVSWPAGVALLFLVLLTRAWQRHQQRAMAEEAGRDATGRRRTRYWADLAAGEAGAKEVRVFGLGPWVLQRHRRQALDYLEPSWRDWNTALTRNVGPTALVALSTAVVYGSAVWLGWQRVIGAANMVQLVVAGSAAIAMTGWRGQIQTVEHASVCLRALDRLQQAVRSPRADDTSVRSADDGWIRLRDLWFSYPGGAPVLQGITLDLAPGEVVAFVGVNGAGKTTLAKVLCGLYPPRSGTLSMPTARAAHPVGVIFADFVRYPLTLAENVRLGAPDHDDQDGVLDAIRVAGAEDLLSRLPAGVDTLLSKVQEGGVDLSGGQWQKVALARAVYAVRHGRSILVMDEPTAHLDAQLEAEFHDRVVRTLAGTTMIMISHRLSTVRAADRIVLIDQGRVAEQGDHATLMAAGGQYARLFRLQASRFADQGAGG